MYDDQSGYYRSEADQEHDAIVNACWCCRLEEAVLKGLCGRCFSDMQSLRKVKQDERRNTVILEGRDGATSGEEQEADGH
jgi:hypothetical protein